MPLHGYPSITGPKILVMGDTEPDMVSESQPILNSVRQNSIHAGSYVPFGAVT